jgi:hypothetical protein
MSRCAYRPENCLAQARLSGYGAPLTSPARVIVGTVMRGAADRAPSSMDPRASGSSFPLDVMAADQTVGKIMGQYLAPNLTKDQIREVALSRPADPVKP